MVKHKKITTAYNVDRMRKDNIFYKLCINDIVKVFFLAMLCSKVGFAITKVYLKIL